MTPEAFWESTPREIADMVRGARWRERREWERVAWLASYVIAPYSKQPPTMAKMLAFLGPEEGTKAAATVPPVTSQEEAAAIVESIAREHKKKFWAMLPDKFAEDGDKEKK